MTNVKLWRSSSLPTTSPVGCERKHNDCSSASNSESNNNMDDNRNPKHAVRHMRVVCLVYLTFTCTLSAKKKEEGASAAT